MKFTVRKASQSNPIAVIQINTLEELRDFVINANGGNNDE